MTNADHPPQASLAALLEELAQDPQATLLALAARAPRRSISDLDERLSANSAGLRPTERELLRQHREEVAELLWQIALDVSLRKPNTNCGIAKFGRNFEPIQRTSDEQVSHSVSRTLALTDRDHVGKRVRMALSHIAHGERLAELRCEELLVLSMRLAPADITRDFYSQCLLLQRQHIQAGRVARSLLERTLSPTMQERAWNTLGRVELMRRDLGMALSYYRRAVDSSVVGGVASINLLGAAIRIGDRSAFHDASQRVELDFKNHPNELLSCTRDIVQQKKLKLWSFQSNSGCIDIGNANCGPLAWEVARAFS